jgi:hypothetical protein
LGRLAAYRRALTKSGLVPADRSQSKPRALSSRVWCLTVFVIHEVDQSITPYMDSGSGRRECGGYRTGYRFKGTGKNAWAGLRVRTMPRGRGKP